MTDHDIIVIGSGSAASKVAHATAAADWDTAVVDSAPIGGTCALRGCMPKKVYVGAAEAIDWANRLDDHGVRSDVTVDWEKVQEYKTSFTEGFNEGIRSGFEKAGVDILDGRASFTGEHSLSVDGDTYTADYFVIATGNKPRPLSFDGSDHLVSSDEFLDLDSIPEDIVFVGGGYISFEFAHVAARTGADVTIFQRDDRPLPMFEKTIVDELLEASEAHGINVELDVEAGHIETDGDKYEVYDQDGEHVASSDLVVHGAGRLPQIDDLELDNAGVKSERRGVSVDDYLQTSQDHIYAAGDCAASPGFPLTPIATFEGEAVAQNLLNEEQTSPDYRATATALFSVPPVASVGMQEDQVEEKGYDYTVNEGDSGEWFSSQRIGLDHGRYKVIVDDATDEILGAHLISHNADEVINVFAAAIKFDITAEELEATPWAYPTGVADTDYMI